MPHLNIINISGGKDSTATLLLALQLNTPNVLPVFCDTGHEHPQTYAYLDYLESRLSISIKRIRYDFTKDMARKRKYILAKWGAEDVPLEMINSALNIMTPTGIPFLDLCIMKGRFPSTKTKFCTTELKVRPMLEQIILPALKRGDEVTQWLGVRGDESASRANLPEAEYDDPGLWLYRPIHSWSAQEVFDFHAKHGIDPNPLYKQGMGRVGCMPCIMSRKAEILEISKRFPEQIDRVREWEALVSRASKSGYSTLFPVANGHGEGGIDAEVKWSRTEYGGKQFSLEALLEAPQCSSLYGLCE